MCSNQFDETHEHILTQIMEDVMTYEFLECEDLTTYLRENTAATKTQGAYFKRQPVAVFIKKIVEDACDHCLEDYKEDLEIDPSAVKYNIYIVYTIFYNANLRKIYTIYHIRYGRKK